MGLQRGKNLSEASYWHPLDSPFHVHLQKVEVVFGIIVRSGISSIYVDSIAKLLIFFKKVNNNFA
jgi:hypothetical protein